MNNPALSRRDIVALAATSPVIALFPERTPAFDPAAWLAEFEEWGGQVAWCHADGRIQWIGYRVWRNPKFRLRGTPAWARAAELEELAWIPENNRAIFDHLMQLDLARLQAMEMFQPLQLFTEGGDA